MNTVIRLMIAAAVLLFAPVAGAQSGDEKQDKKSDKEKPKGPPVPRFEGKVRLVLFADIVDSDEKKKRKQVSLQEIREALAGVSEIEHEPGSREISVRLKGTYADVDRIRLALKDKKIKADILSPARVVIQPAAKIADMEQLEGILNAIPGVQAIGRGRQWGQPDPSIGILSVGAVLDARPIVSSDRKYVTITARATDSTLRALRTVSINPVIAFVDLDKVSPKDLRKAVARGSTVPSHREYLYTYETIGKGEKAVEEIRRIPGVLRVNLDEDKQQVSIRCTSRVYGFKVELILRKHKFKKVKPVRQ